MRLLNITKTDQNKSQVLYSRWESIKADRPKIESLKRKTDQKYWEAYEFLRKARLLGYQDETETAYKNFINIEGTRNYLTTDLERKIQAADSALEKHNSPYILKAKQILFDFLKEVAAKRDFSLGMSEKNMYTDTKTYDYQTNQKSVERALVYLKSLQAQVDSVQRKPLAELQAIMDDLDAFMSNLDLTKQETVTGLSEAANLNIKDSQSNPLDNSVETMSLGDAMALKKGKLTDVEMSQKIDSLKAKK